MKGSVLVITNSQDETADYLITKTKSHLKYTRFDTDLDLTNFNVRSTDIGYELVINKKRLLVNEIDSVWYRRPKPFRLSSKIDDKEKKHAIGEWQEAIEGILSLISRDRWINYPLYNNEASYKIEQLNRADKFGLNVPKTIITSKKNQLKKFSNSVEGVVIKPISHGYLEGVDEQNDGLIYTNELTQSDMDSFPEENYCPTLFQEKIKKAYDIRIVVLDYDLIALKLYSKDQSHVDVRRDNMKKVKYSKYLLPDKLKRKIFLLVNSYSLRFAAIDFVKSVNGSYYFLEINPNGQWAWTDQYGISEIYKLFVKAFTKS